MPRHKYVPLPQPTANGAVMGCESCGALNNEGRVGCLPDEIGISSSLNN